MSDAEWRPLSVRQGRREGYDALYEGVPSWLRPSLRTWMINRFYWANNLDAQLIWWLQRKSRLDIDWPDSSSEAADRILDMSVSWPEEFLDMVDAVISGGHASTEAVEELAGLLRDAGSVYEVTRIDGQDVLERRVDATVAASAKLTMAKETRASTHLRDAWHEAYGRNPSPSSAYREAVRAVEAAAQPIVEPNNTRATLGTMIGALTSTKERLEVALRPSEGDPMDSLIEMMRVLWKAQLDRHGTADESVPIRVSQEEAETAVHLAVTLVHWFQSGAVRPR
jgi:hypothetical protein